MALEARALNQFDRLVESGDLLWKDNPPRYVEFKPFNFEFRIASSLQRKPQNEDEGTSKHAFQDPSPDFDLGLFGPKHRLVLNKFCVVRPQFVVHTAECEPQTDGLNEADFGAAWEALEGMGETYMVIFNCGPDAGASVAHKHLQLIPVAEHVRKHPFPTERREVVEPHAIDGLPYQHMIMTLPQTVSVGPLYDIYSNTLRRFGIEPSEPHNMLLTTNWLMVIPRRRAWISEVAANAAAMIGMAWCKSEEQYQGWQRRGIGNVLRGMGKPSEEGQALEQ